MIQRCSKFDLISKYKITHLVTLQTSSGKESISMGKFAMMRGELAIMRSESIIVSLYGSDVGRTLVKLHLVGTTAARTDNVFYSFIIA